MKLTEAMLKANISRERLAELTALSPRAIKSYEYNERIPSEINQGRIERVLKNKIEWTMKR
jgi:transcriptional regulator with XRE-family HTH domain